MRRFQRSDRVSEELLREISQIVLREMKDPRLATAGLVSFTRVEVTKDFRNATVFVSIFGSEAQAEEVMAALRNGAGFIRTTIGKRIRMRVSPELVFKHDDSIAHSARIHQLLKESDPTVKPTTLDDDDLVDDEESDE